jgi:glycopeptide antibiotics resistance protein
VNETTHLPSNQARSVNAVAVARLAYVGVLALATLVPFRFDFEVTAIMDRLAGGLHPLLTPRDAVDAARNLVLFAGWGALWLVTSRSARAPTAVARATVSGGLLSLGLETLQLFSASRTASVLDLMTNTAGSLAGALAIFWLTAAGQAARGRRSFVGIPAFLFAGAYLGAVFLEAFFPLFRQTTVPGASGGPAVRISESLHYFEVGSVFAIPVLDILLFLPAGTFAVAALVESGQRYRAAAWLTGLGGLGLAVFAELGHGFLGRPMELGAIIAHAAAIACGAWLAALRLPQLSRQLRGRGRPLALMIAYIAILCLWAWRPLRLEIDPQAIAAQFSVSRWVPLRAYGVRVDLFSVSDVIVSFLLFLPLGSLLAVWPLRLRGRLRRFLPGVYLAGLTEAGQLLVAGRFFDITDILIASAGAVIGWSVIRRAAYRPYGELLAAKK